MGRGHNHSMVKQRVCGDKFILSREATNMNNTHTPRFSGYANKKSAGVAPNAGGKGLVFTFASDETNKPNKAFVSVPLTSGIRPRAAGAVVRGAGEEGARRRRGPE